jgi:hypothetical protein
MRIILRIAVGLLLAFGALAGFAWWYDYIGQRSDPGFAITVSSPAYPATGVLHPAVLIDEAHRNFHTASGRYQPFAGLLRSDGYVVSGNQQIFTPQALRNASVLVIADAMGPEDHETRPAFTPEEELVVEEWVNNGGSLFLISDHSPFGSAVARLAQKFGVTMYWRFARDDRFHDGWDNERLDFSRSNGLLADNEITNGRSASERISRVVTFTGQSLTGPADTIPLLRLSDGAYDWESRKVRFPAKGHLQALALSHGKGRLVVSGEAALFSAQVDPLGIKFGMNRKGNDDRQFLLNILHWLTHAL